MHRIRMILICHLCTEHRGTKHYLVVLTALLLIEPCFQLFSIRGMREGKGWRERERERERGGGDFKSVFFVQPSGRMPPAVLRHQNEIHVLTWISCCSLTCLKMVEQSHAAMLWIIHTHYKLYGVACVCFVYCVCVFVWLFYMLQYPLKVFHT